MGSARDSTSQGKTMAAVTTPGTPTPPETPSRRGGPPLSRSVKLSFGAPSFAGAALAIPIGILLPRFYTDVVLAPAGWVALAIAIARCFDAITDPMMGWASDRTRSRWGRRKPWMALGVPLAAIAVYALFAPPRALSPQAAAVWFGVTFSLYFIFHTVYEIPHGALGAEVALDYDERSSLFGIRSVFIMFGTITAAVLPSILPGILGTDDARTVYATIAGLFAVLLVGLYALLLWKVPERREFQNREPNPLAPGVRRALRNRPFRILFLSGLIGAVPAAIPAVLLPYFTRYVLVVPNPDAVLGNLLLIYFGVGLLSIPLWMRIAQRFGKLQTLVAAALIGTAGQVLLFALDVREPWFVYLIFVLLGTQSATGIFLLPSMGADVIDYDEFLTGKRREAQFGAFWAIIPKFVSIPGASIPIALLAWQGYVPNQAQTPEVLFMIRFLIGVFPALFNIAALLILMRYPISARVHERIRDGIAAHARGETAPDPIDAHPVPPPGARAVSEEMGWFLDTFSPRELRRIMTHGPRCALNDVLGQLAIATMLTGTLAWFATRALPGLDVEPGPQAVLAVVGCGLALTALLFQVTRLPNALRLRRAPVPVEEIRRHLTQS